jgi:hypothetical protein
LPGGNKFIAFLREPLERCYSEYLHHKRHNNLEGTFGDFFQNKWQINLQTKFLNGIDGGSLIGVSEYFSESVRRIGSELGLEIACFEENVYRNRLGSRYAATEVSEEDAYEFYQLNSSDVELYSHHVGKFAGIPEPTSQLRPRKVSKMIRKIKRKLL